MPTEISSECGVEAWRSIHVDAYSEGETALNYMLAMHSPDQDMVISKGLCDSSLGGKRPEGYDLINEIHSEVRAFMQIRIFKDASIH